MLSVRLSEAVDMCRGQMCDFCSKPGCSVRRQRGGGALTGLLATVNLLAWSKVFHVEFYVF